MHRLIRDHLEQALAEPGTNRPDGANVHELHKHLELCGECREEVARMREQAAMLRTLRADREPRPGFYARVIERIEAQGAVSIWSAFSESAFGRRLAAASMAIALLLSVYLVVSEPRHAPSTALNRPLQLIIGQDRPDFAFSNTGLPDRDAVLVNLVTYRER